MTDIDPDIEGLEVVIELQGVDETVAADLRTVFDAPGDDVVFSHAFGGLDVVAIVTKLGAATIGKLIAFAARLATHTPKTVFKIDKHSITMNGFSRADIEALLASPGFKQAVRTARRA